MVPDKVCFALYAPDPESILVVNPVLALKLIPEFRDHVAPFTVRFVKSSDITNDPNVFIVVRLLCGSTRAMVV